MAPVIRRRAFSTFPPPLGVSVRCNYRDYVTTRTSDKVGFLFVGYRILYTAQILPAFENTDDKLCLVILTSKTLHRHHRVSMKCNIKNFIIVDAKNSCGLELRWRFSDLLLPLLFLPSSCPATRLTDRPVFDHSVHYMYSARLRVSSASGAAIYNLYVYEFHHFTQLTA